MEVIIFALIFWALKKLPQIMEARIKGAAPMPVGRTMNTDVKTIPFEDAKRYDLSSSPEGTVTLEAPRNFVNMETPAALTGELQRVYTPLISPPQTQTDLYSHAAQHVDIDTNTHTILPSLTGDDLVRAVIMSEILARPTNRRRRV